MKEVSIESFIVNGQSVRTNNALETGAAGKIPALWSNFYASQSAASESLFGVYSAYESDASGDFTVTAGKKTCDGNSGVEIRPGIYLVFPAEGEMPTVVINAWKAVWKYFSKDQPHERAFETDFEQYNGPTSATIYIGVKTSS